MRFTLIFLSLVPLYAFSQSPDQIKSLPVRLNEFTYLSNQDLNRVNPKITEAVVVIHGSELNAWNYFRSIQIVADQLKLTSQTLIVAPQFRTPTQSPPTGKELSFGDEAWLRGDESDQDFRVTSFDVMDLLISKIANLKIFPSLKTIVVTGHSAGGQFTQRYALGSRNTMRYRSIHFKYLVLNSGSYAYLNSKRPDPTHNGLFSIPSTRQCSTYDDYKYGLKHLNSYLLRTATSVMLQEYLEKDVTYFLGALDTDTSELDNSCEAILQGPNRYARGLYFKAFLDSEFANHQHSVVVAMNAAHSQRTMYTTPEGMKLLFQNAGSRNPARKSVRIEH